MSSKLLEDLNPQQRAAVTHANGPMLVVAGAGTGKTAVITRRIAHLIAAKAAKPEEIVALTFTEKAANEMEIRVDQLVPYGYTQTFVGTFHSFGERLLRRWALEAGLPPDFSLLNAVQSAALLRDHLFDIKLDLLRPAGNPAKYADALVRLFSRAKEELVSPVEYQEFAEKLTAKTDAEKLIRTQQLEIAAAYAAYEEVLAQEGLVDFADLVAKPYHVLRARPDILEKVQSEVRFLLVDEFQDTNVAQNELVMLLAGEQANVMVVGDDDQAIYKFRGAALSNILQFRDRFPRAKIATLRKNYRSSQQILDSAYRLIGHNNPDRLEATLGIDKHLTAQTTGPLPQQLHADTVDTEVEVVVQLLQERKKILKIPWSECALLVRAHAHALPFVAALKLRGIPTVTQSGTSFFRHPDVIALAAALRAINNNRDDLSLYTLATSFFYAIDGASMTALASLRRAKNLSLYVMLTKDIFPAEVGEEARAQLRALGEDLTFLKEQTVRKNAGEVLYALLERRGIIRELTHTESAQAEERLGRIAHFFDLVREFVEREQQPTVARFVEHLNLLEEEGENAPGVADDPDVDGVRVLTAHAAKGLEFELVVIANCVMDRFPTRARSEGLELPDGLIKEQLPASTGALNEERRLFYVAMTRAKKELYFSSASSYGGVRTKNISPFVLEALDFPTAEPQAISRSAQERIKAFAAPASKKPLGQNRAPVKSLTAYQIDDYLTCPLRYYYIHRLRIPIATHQSILYGSAIHAAIAYFFRERVAGRTPRIASVLEVFKNKWVNEGFLSRQHEELRLREGAETLTMFYETFKGGEVPIAVEQPFKIPYNGIQLRGVIDVVFGTLPKSRVVDFKTSKVIEPKKAEARTKESTQLAVYALAWKQMHGHAPEAVQLYFLESNLAGSEKKDEKDFVKLKEKIDGVVAGINAGDFRAKPSPHACAYCPYNRICPYSAVNPKGE